MVNVNYTSIKPEVGGKSILFSFHIFLNFPVLLLLRDFLFHPFVVRKDTWNYFSLFKFVKTWLWPIMYPGECCLCTWMYMCCCLVVCLNMSVRTTWTLHVFIKACFIDFLSIFISGLLKSLTAIVWNQFFFFNSSICFIPLCALMLYAYIIFISSCWSDSFIKYSDLFLWRQFWT